MVVTGVTIESVSSQLTTGDGGFPRGADQIVDGSGLSGGLHSTIADGTMWDADTFSPPFTSTGTDTDPQVTFDLGSAVIVGSFEVWNYGDRGFSGSPIFSGTPFTQRGVKNFEVFASLDNVGYSSIGTFALAEAPGGSSPYAGEVIAPTSFLARYVRFDIIDNHADDFAFGVGLSEVQFTAVPEPSGVGLLSMVAVFTCCLRRRWRSESTS